MKRSKFSLPALALVSACCALAACTVGPRYQRPDAPVGQAFKEQAAGSDALKPAQPKDALVKGKWWELFGDPGLNTLEEQVAVSNQTLAQAAAQYRGARAAVRTARAGLFPTVGVSASATRSRTGPGRGTTVTSGDQTVYQLPLDFSYEADLWGKVRRGVEASVASAQASAADVENVRLSLEAELAVDYFQLHGLDQQRQLLNSTVDAYQTALKLTRNRYQQGVVSGVDVAQAETQLETTRAEATDLSESRAQLEHAIAILIGKPPSELTLPPAPIGVAPPAIPAALPADLLERRPDVAGAERRMAAANAQIGVAVAAYFPDLTFSGSAGFESSTLSKLLSLPNRFWSLGPALAQTLFDGGKRRAATEQAQASYDGTVAVYRQDVLNALQDVEDNLAALRILAQEVKEQEGAVAAAERSLTLAKNRYTGGITTYLEVITAQNAALANERTAVDLVTRQMTASVNLVKAIGGGWTTGDLPKAVEVATR